LPKTLPASERAPLLRAFGVEIIVYAVLVTAYVLLVLHFMGGWLRGLFDAHRRSYAIMTLVLMFGQGAMLEMLTAGLLKIIRRRTR
jgi:hypothetical protein